MFLDMVINFMLAYKIDDDGKYIDELSKTSKRYLKTGFLPDFIVWQPFTYFLSSDVNIVWVLLIIKSTRFSQLFNVLDERNIVPLIRSFYDNLNKRAIKDPEKAEDRLRDHNHISHRLMTQ